METAKSSRKKIKTQAITEETTNATVLKEDILKIAKTLHSKDNLAFDHLSFVTAVDYGDYFELVYQLYSYKRKHSLTIKTSVPKKNPVIDSVISVWLAADWHEREVYDLFGIEFKGHPNLKRMFLPDDFPGHPLRKDYPNENNEEYILK